MATAEISTRYRAEYMETYVSNFLTAVGGTTTETDIDLPPGWYDAIHVYGYHTASTPPTLLVQMYVNDGTAVRTIPAQEYDTAAPNNSAVSLDSTKRGLWAYFVPRVYTTTGPKTEALYLPYGLKTTYTKNGATEVNLTLVARRVG